MKAGKLACRRDSSTDAGRKRPSKDRTVTQLLQSATRPWRWGPLGHSWGFWVEGSLRRWLAKADPIVFTIVAGLAGFSAYFSMYAFRKPFTAATFDAVAGWHFALDYKIALVIAQAAGYALSKLIGVKVISEIGPARRGMAILMATSDYEEVVQVADRAVVLARGKVIAELEGDDVTTSGLLAAAGG